MGNFVFLHGICYMALMHAAELKQIISLISYLIKEHSIHCIPEQYRHQSFSCSNLNPTLRVRTLAFSSHILQNMSLTCIHRKAS